jgi:hypothetical protein
MYAAREARATYTGLGRLVEYLKTLLKLGFTFKGLLSFITAH